MTSRSAVTGDQTSASVSAALLEQFLSCIARPSGFGDPGPLRFSLRDHTVEVDSSVCDDLCLYQESVAFGDARLGPTSRHIAAEQARRNRAIASVGIRARRRLDDRLWLMRQSLGRLGRPTHTTS